MYCIGTVQVFMIQVAEHLLFMSPPITVSKPLLARAKWVGVCRQHDLSMYNQATTMPSVVPPLQKTKGDV